jgi:hypothetical protein
MESLFHYKRQQHVNAEFVLFSPHEFLLLSLIYIIMRLYKGITGITELACVTKALLTEIYDFPFIDFKLSVILKAVASK